MSDWVGMTPNTSSPHAHPSTPIQNNVEELYSLFKFLRARPLDDWDTFKRIVALVKDGRTKIAMKKLHVVLKVVMLRRAKDAKIGTLRVHANITLTGRRQTDSQPARSDCQSGCLSIRCGRACIL